MLARLAQLAIVCVAVAAFSVENVAADEPPAAASPALIGLAPEAQPPQPPPNHRKLWIALGVISGAAVVGAVVAVGVIIGTSSNDNSPFNNWGTVTVTRR